MSIVTNFRWMFKDFKRQVWQVSAGIQLFSDVFELKKVSTAKFFLMFLPRSKVYDNSSIWMAGLKLDDYKPFTVNAEFWLENSEGAKFGERTGNFTFDADKLRNDSLEFLNRSDLSKFNRRLSSNENSYLCCNISYDIPTMKEPKSLMTTPTPISQKGTLEELVVALDCECVMIGTNNFKQSLARVSIVNAAGEIIYDKYIKPLEPVADYLTHINGITPEHLENGLKFSQVQEDVKTILAGKIVVGHAVHNDFRSLKLTHPPHLIRDTSMYTPFLNTMKIGNTPSLKSLAQKILNAQIQDGSHCSIEDAKTALKLYLLKQDEWEAKSSGIHLDSIKTL